jgi:hypothetical protein
MSQNKTYLNRRKLMIEVVLSAVAKDCPMFQPAGEDDYPYNCYCVAHCCDDCKYYEVSDEEH